MDADDETLQPDELLKQLTWVRGLARGLVADPEASRDIVQQVCLLALQQAPPGARTGPPLRAWLAAVARSLARRRVRTERRRARREEIAARPEALAATVDTAAHREALRQLIDAVTALQEPYYSVVVARYFEERSVAEIAARSGDTAAAVRQRLVRARRQLRERLESRIAEDPKGTLRAALPLAAPASLTGHGLRAILGRFGGSMAMTAGKGGGTKAAAGIVVLLLIGGGAWFALHEPAPSSTAPSSAPGFASAASSPAPPVAALAQEAPPAEVQPLRAPPDPVPSVKQPPAKADSPAEQLFSLVVVDSHSRPVPEARLELWTNTQPPGIRNRSFEAKTELVSTSVTDRAGRGSVLFTKPENYLVASKEGVGLTGRLRSRDVASGLDTEGDAVVVLQPALVVDGRVLQASGAAACGVPVEIEAKGHWDMSGRYITRLTSSAPDGRFHAELAPVESLELSAVAQDGTRVERECPLPADGQLDVTLQFPGSWWIRGTAVDAVGRPAPRAQVKVFHGEGLSDPWGSLSAWSKTSDELTTDGTGQFAYRARALEPHVLIAVYPTAPPSDPALVVLDAIRPEAGITLQQPVGVTVSGRVRHGDGTAAPEAWVGLRLVAPLALQATQKSTAGGLASSLGAFVSTKPDATGAFAFDSLNPRGLFDVVLSRRPLVVSKGEVVREGVQAGTQGLELVLPDEAAPAGGASIHVLATVAGTGEPAPLFTLGIAKEGERVLSERGVKADNGGDLLISEIPPGHPLIPGQAYTLILAFKGLSTVDLHDVVAGDPPPTLHVDVPATGTLEVDVVDAHGTPQPFVPLRVERSFTCIGFHNDGAPGPADSTGHASFGPLDVGSYTVIASIGGVESRASGEVPGGAAGRVRLVLKGGK